MVRATWLTVDLIIDASLPENWLGMRPRPWWRPTYNFYWSTIFRTWGRNDHWFDLMGKFLRFSIFPKEEENKETSLYHRDLLLTLTTIISHCEITNPPQLVLSSQTPNLKSKMTDVTSEILLLEVLDLEPYMCMFQSVLPEINLLQSLFYNMLKIYYQNKLASPQTKWAKGIVFHLYNEMQISHWKTNLQFQKTEQNGA